MLKRKFEETEGLSQAAEGANPESDDSNCSAGSTDALAPDAFGQPPAKRPKKKVHFKGVTVFYFPRRQGFTCVPSEGGSTLGMSEKHTFHRDFSLSDYTKEQKRIHRAILAEQRRQGKLFPSPLLGNASVGMSESMDDISSGSESDSEYDDYYFLQPLPIRQRRVLLRTAGVKKIDNEEKDECRDIRVSRNVCGCDCKIFCDPETCACSLAGIQCQVDRLSFPCGCTKDGCANPSGRIEFNPIRVKTHFIHTLMRLELERKDREIQDPDNPGSSSSLTSSSLLSSQTLLSCDDSNKIVDVVGEDNEVGMVEGDEESEVVNGTNTELQSEDVEEDKKKAATSHGPGESCCSSSSGNSNNNNNDTCVGIKVLKSNLKLKKEESIDLNLFNSNERGSCRDCQNTDMCNVMMHDVKFSMVSQQQRQQQQQQQQQQQRAMAQSLFTGQQILHSHSLSPPSPGLSLFQPLPQQTASPHHHMMMFNDADDDASYHADTSGPLYFDNDEGSYPDINESSSDASFPVITQTSSGNFRTGPTVMFTTSMNTGSHSPGSGLMSSPVRLMRPQVSLLHRSTVNQFGIRPMEMGIHHDYGPGAASELGMTPTMCNGVSSLSQSSQQQQAPLQHQHDLHSQSLLSVSKATSTVAQVTTEHCNPQRLVSPLESTAEGMPNICHSLNQSSNITQQGILSESDPLNGPLSMPGTGVVPGLTMGFSDSSNSNISGTFHTNLVSSLGKSTSDQMKQDPNSMPDQNYSSVLTVPVYHATPNHSEGAYEPSDMSNMTTATSTSISVNCITSTADSMSGDTTLQHQPLLSCWSSSLTSPTIPECFAGMGSSSLVPPSLISQTTSESAKSDSVKQGQSLEGGSPSQALPSPSSTTYTTMTTTTRDQLAAYCPGISSHMDNRNEGREAQCGPVTEPKSTFPEFTLDEDAKPTSSLLADSQSVLFNSFSHTAESDSSSSLTAASLTSPFSSPSVADGKALSDPTSQRNAAVSSSSVTLSSLPVQNGHVPEAERDGHTVVQSDGITSSSEVTKELTLETDKPNSKCSLTKSDSTTGNEWSSEYVQSKMCTTMNEDHQETESVTSQDDSGPSAVKYPDCCYLDNDKDVHKLTKGLANGETSPDVPSTSSTQSPSSSSLTSNAALSSLLSLPSSTLSSSSSPSSSAPSSTSSSDDEQKGLAPEFDHIVKKSMAEMVSA